MAITESHVGFGRDEFVRAGIDRIDCAPRAVLPAALPGVPR